MKIGAFSEVSGCFILTLQYSVPMIDLQFALAH